VFLSSSFFPLLLDSLIHVLVLFLIIFAELLGVLIDPFVAGILIVVVVPKIL